MEERERVTGERALELLERTQEDRTVITMFLLGKGYDCLTVITGIRMEEGLAYLAVDTPSGFAQVAGGPDEWRMRFDFTAKDKISYTFKTFGGEIRGDEIYVPCPKFVERIQRRASFRQEAPVGTKLHLESDSRQPLTVHDISEGGALVSSEKSEHQRRHVFDVGEQLMNVKMLFPWQEEELTVEFEKTLVRRVKKDPITLCYQYGLQFIKIHKDEKKAFVELIHQFERGLLRKRQFLAE